jgi:16S rRNA processing protein RimM
MPDARYLLPMSEPSLPADLVIVGRIRRSHGVLGVVVVEPMTSSPELVFSPGRDLVAGTVKGDPSVPERVLRIEMAEPFQGGFRVQFSGIAGRDEAERWRDRYVLSPRAGLPEPDENQVYLYDLIGLTVEGAAGEVIGSVEAYYELRHDVMIEVARPSGSVMIPYRFVTEVDLNGRRLVVEPPEGLL